MAAMLKVNDIHVYYGKIHAVKGVSFEVNEGEIVSLIGANGAGKSTILKTVSGLMHPKSGTIEFMGKDIAHMEPNKIVTKGLVHVPEGRRVFAHMSVMENIEMGAYILGKVPEAQGAAQAGSGHAFRRRAADACHGARAHEQAQAYNDGRA